MGMTRNKAALTHEQIIEKWNGMTSRERDAWVAEVVFEYPHVRLFHFRYVYDNVGYVDGKPFDVMGTIDVPDYTTDLNEAEGVLAQIPGEVYIYRKPSLGFVVSFGYSTEECPECGELAFEVQAQGIAPTLPGAICLAALIAKKLVKNAQ
ncbi:hypothetical protein [Paenibacillus apiarius]|uniref:hypothetical protein n=1 Tax=Paenibacillus apiarius TaxID=46240 RepID=UPI003B3A02FE